MVTSVGVPDGSKILRELLEIWDRLQQRQSHVERTIDAIRHATLVHGFAAHSAQLGRAVLTLMAENLWVPSYPLVRLVLEDAILVEWLESRPGSWRELLRRSSADFIRLVDQIAEYGNLTDGLAQFRSQAESMLQDLGGRASGRFTVERQMMDLAGAGKALYTDYRILSQYCHAGKAIVDLYSIEDRSAPGGVASLAQPKFALTASEHSALVGYAAAGFLQTLLAWSRCTADDAEQDRLRAIARKLGVTDTPARRTEQ